MTFPKEAIVLAGGMGTRLRSVISEMPKPMASVAGIPFLEYLFVQLQKAGFEKVILSVGYKWEMIQERYGSKFENLDLMYAVEEEPLGTGGGIKLAFSHCSSNDVFVFNGDTMFDFDLQKFQQLHQNSQSILSLALKEMQDFDRYGTVSCDESGRIIRFEEKKPLKSGLINAGVYIINQKLWSLINVESKFSFEKAVMEAYVNQLKFMGFEFNGYFIDIGIPEDYAKAQIDFPKQFLGK